MPTARFMVAYRDASSGRESEVAVTAGGMAEARAKAESLGLRVTGARLVEILDDPPERPDGPAPDGVPGGIPGGIPGGDPGGNPGGVLRETACPRCGSCGWESGRGPLPWFIAGAFFPLGMLAPLTVTPRHRCRGCGYTYTSPAPPVGAMESDGSAARGIALGLVVGATVWLAVAGAVGWLG